MRDKLIVIFIPDNMICRCHFAFALESMTQLPILPYCIETSCILLVCNWKKFKTRSWFCSYGLAIEFQQRAIDAWENHGPGARDEFREAHRLLEQLKRKARASATDDARKALPSSIETDISGTSSSRPSLKPTYNKQSF